MRKLVSIFLCCMLLWFSAKADHITGGEMFYTHNGSGQYNFTLKLYMRCNSGRSFNNPTVISVFNKAGGTRVMDINVPLSNQETISLTSPDPCISNPPTVCYEIGYYNFTVNLPATPDGYIVAGQVNYRVGGISNLSGGYSQIGATYTAEIPGTLSTPDLNNSARFIGSDLVIICADNPFQYSFAATDADGDLLRYSFCEAYQSSSHGNGGGGFGGGGGGGNNATAPLSPPYQPVPYDIFAYSGSAPLGTNVSIDASSGLIKGRAPAYPGIYVLTVCVEEIRAGKVIATQRKDLQVNITSCSITAAILQPEYMLCDTSMKLTVANESTSTLISSYDWEFSKQNGTIVYASKTPVASHTFADTGTYNIKLTINRGDQCSDSVVSLARVYPGFVPNFSFAGICINKPTQFTDISTTVYGTVNSWRWDLGPDAVPTNEQNHDFTFTTAGTRNVQLIATNTKGCRDTIVKPVAIVVNPPLLLAFKDTLICPPDNLQLRALGTGTYTWSPNINLQSNNDGFPIVSPTTTTTYYAQLNDNGCINRDSVTVRVTNQVILQAMPDTVICQGDAILLRAGGNANIYSWSSGISVLSTGINSNMNTRISSTGTYRVLGSISQCTATDEVQVTTVPYPMAYAGNDTTICYNTSAVLLGNTNGSSYQWMPAATLSSARVLTPVATPKTTTRYVLYTYDTQGCPKPGTDTVLVTVTPKIYAFAGNDTTAVTGQELTLQATGGVRYQWQPPTGLSATNIANPIGIYSEDHEMIRYKVAVYDQAGCVDSAFVSVKIFNTSPTLFVPSAFTPNGDGKNDLLRPIAAGIKQLERFAVYNRWGQLVYQTAAINQGWDGNINGQQQASGSYIWQVQAIDYKGRLIVQKGFATLIR